MIATKEKKSSIAIQGGLGSFHHMAASHIDGATENKVVPCIEFEDVFRHTADVAEGAGIVAIENTIAGSLLNNYRLLDRFPVQISGEIFLRIHQNLMALPGVDLSGISEIHSHPIALAQCYVFLKKYPHIKLIEAEDTAMVAERIAATQNKTQAAIASKAAAEMFGLNILARGIENNPENYTRFLQLEKMQHETAGRKASLSLILSHERGSLNKLLSIAYEEGLNLTKIQSLPIIGKAWHYRFYIDLERENPMNRVWLEKVFGAVTDELKIHGIYTPGKFLET